MPRVAWLCLPDFATDRLRRLDRLSPAPAPAPPPDPEDMPPLAAEASVARGGGWRPGARWADEAGSADWLTRRLAKKRAKKAAIQAQIDTLPAHQRPPMRELGRRSEAAPVPFRAGPSAWEGGGSNPFPPMAVDEGAALAAAEPSDFGGHVRRRAGDVRYADAHGLPPAQAPRDGSPDSDDKARHLSPSPSRIHSPPGAGRDPAGAGVRGAEVSPRLLPAQAHRNVVWLGWDSVKTDGAGIPPKQRAPAEEGPAPSRPPYDLEGAFWQQGAAVGREVARAVAGQGRGRPPSAPPPAAGGPTPLVTTRRDGQRIVLAAACPVARSRGLSAGMALTHARAMLPGLDARPQDEGAEAADLARLAAHAARHWTPLAQVRGQGLLLDIGGSAHLFGGEGRLCRHILRLCRRLGLTARIAVADTAVAARALAAHGGGALILCPPGGHGPATAPLAVEALGLADKPVEGLRRLGVETIGQLAAMPRGPLARRFGRATLDALDRLSGATPDPVDPLVPVQAVVVERRFVEPVLTVEGLTHALGDLAARLAADLRERGLGARALVLDCARIDSARQVIALGLAQASRDAAHLARLLTMRIGEIEPGFGIEAMRLVAVRADRLGAEAIPGTLSGDPPVPDLAVLIDRLAVRLGGRRLYRLTMIESEVPERGQRRRPPLVQDAAAWPDPWPRPVRLLDPAEPIDHVLAELPDHPPRRFRWRGREHRVVRGDGPERIHGEWWRRAAEAEAVRDYFQVEDAEGRRFWLFRRGDGVDGRTGDMGWRIHGVFG